MVRRSEVPVLLWTGVSWDKIVYKRPRIPVLKAIHISQRYIDLYD